MNKSYGAHQNVDIFPFNLFLIWYYRNGKHSDMVFHNKMINLTFADRSGALRRVMKISFRSLIYIHRCTCMYHINVMGKNLYGSVHMIILKYYVLFTSWIIHALQTNEMLQEILCYLIYMNHNLINVKQSSEYVIVFRQKLHLHFYKQTCIALNHNILTNM